MALKVLLTSALVAVAASLPVAPIPAYGPAPPAYPDLPPVYKYGYAVKDDYSFVNFNANEQRDGYDAAGSYSVALPDGRTQTVTYTATKDGYVADVTYAGEAKYPEYNPTYPAAPVYAPAPVYHAAPAPAYAPIPVYKPAAPVAAPAAKTEEAPAPVEAEAPVEESVAVEPKEVVEVVEVVEVEDAPAAEEVIDLRTTDDEPAEYAAPVEEKAAPAEEPTTEEAAAADE